MNKYIVIFIIILIALIAGCNNNGDNVPDNSYKPLMELTLNKNSINVGSDTLSETITLTLVKKDNEKVKSSFVIELISPEKEFIYFSDDTNKLIESMNSTLFEHEGDRQLYDFKAYAKKDPQKDSVEYILKFKLLHNGEEIGNMPNLKVRVI